MKTLIAAFVLSALFFSTSIFAGANHSHGHSHSHEPTPVKQGAAEKHADDVIDSLIERDKIEKSWGSIKASSVEKQKFDGRTEWVVVYVNEKISNTDKQKLYVFLTLSGEYIAVNHTGN